MKSNILKKDRIIDSLQIGKDVLNGNICVSISGNNEVWIENYRGILDFSLNSILIQAKDKRLLIEGNKLLIEYYTDEDMKIVGNIEKITYL